MNKAAVNTFSDGLITDLAPLSTPKTVLTDCLNGTIITYNGNEFSLQNDMGNVKMDNINDLNLGAVYDINDSFSLNVKANNLFSQRYDIWYGYPAQGINIAGGFTFKF